MKQDDLMGNLLEEDAREALKLDSEGLTLLSNLCEMTPPLAYYQVRDRKADSVPDLS